jgi:hypothetical protein
MKARARRYQAEIHQALISELSADGVRTFLGTGTARDLLSPNVENSTLKIRAAFAPYSGWDLLEQADIHFLTAFVAHNLNHGIMEPVQLAEAKSAYQTAILEVSNRFWPNRAARRRKVLAEEGLTRVIRAEKGEYDWRWLIPA